MPDKLDLKQALKECYAPPRKPVMVDVPELGFLMVDGRGYPGRSQEYTDAVGALYPVAYAVKFASKARGQDFTVMPLEGLWWADDMDAFLTEEGKDEWQWTMMIAVPDFVTADDVDAAREAALEKEAKETAKAVRTGAEFQANPALGQVRYERYAEGLSAQIMHIGPYSEETENIQAIHALIDEQGLERHGKHHEIYLSDPRRVAPEKMKTVVRQPAR